MKLTRHNGRSGSGKAYNPLHNDRRFEIENSTHIDPVMANANIYWDCYQGFTSPYPDGETGVAEFSFKRVEQVYYNEHYGDFVFAQNERNKKNRHTERNRTIDDLLTNTKTCPEESIYQIGTMDESASSEVLFMIANEYFEEFEKRYGSHVHIIDWALHRDEATPHIHERHVFDCKNKYGELCPQQEKALEELGIPLPHPDRPKGRNNNRKQTFDKECRELLFEICARHGLELEKEPTYGGRGYMEKQDFIIANQREKIAAQTETIRRQNAEIGENQIELVRQDTAINDAIMQLSDVEAFADEVAENAYKKACEAVTDEVQRQTRMDDVAIIKEYSEWLGSSDRKADKAVRDYAVERLKKVMEKIEKAAGAVTDGLKRALRSPVRSKKLMEQVKEEAKTSIYSKLEYYAELARQQDSMRDHSSLPRKIRSEQML